MFELHIVLPMIMLIGLLVGFIYVSKKMMKMFEDR
jgi:uncharacterized protein YneF (UPF0154 family)